MTRNVWSNPMSLVWREKLVHLATEVQFVKLKSEAERLRGGGFVRFMFGQVV